jgi:hypothetical protein
MTALVHQAKAQAWALTNVWFVTNGIGHLANNNENRGIAYSFSNSQGTNQVFVATRASATTGSIDVFDGASGTLLSGATGVTGANLGIDQIGLADDGILYGAPLQTSVTTSAPFQLYSWTNWTTAPYLAYQSTNASDPLFSFAATKRVGDTLAVTGAGTNTLILATVATYCTNFLLLHTVDGVNFTSTLISVPSLPAVTSGQILGISFYTNNTFLVQPGSGASSRNVYLVSFPTNFASQGSVTGTILGSAAALSASSAEFLSYSPAGQMLASLQVQTAASTTCAVDIFGTTNFPASAGVLATNSYATPNANGNATGCIALGGLGKTNFVYALETDNGVRAYQINYASSLGPVLSALAGGITNGYPSWTLSVTVTAGTAPFYYQWYVISNGATNLIAGANTNTYTITTPVTNFYFVVVTNAAPVANVVTSSVAGVSLLTPLTNAAVTPLWTLAPGSIPSISDFNGTSYRFRGMTYDTNTQIVLINDGTNIYLLNATNGGYLGLMNMAGLPTSGAATWLVDQMGVADDGVLYTCNLTTTGPGFDIIGWSTIAPGQAATSYAYGGEFGADPGNGNGDEWGNTMSVRGGGTNTEILIGSQKDTNVVLFTTTDGFDFTANLIGVTNVSAGFSQLGIAFGAGDTFYATGLGARNEVAFNRTTWTGGSVQAYANLPYAMGGIAVDVANNILGGVSYSDSPHDLQLYLLSSTESPLLFNQAFFATENADIQDNASTVLKGGMAFALDNNNGVVAVSYTVPNIPTSISSEPASVSTFLDIPSLTLSVSAAGVPPLTYEWQFSASGNAGSFTNIPGATNSTYTLTDPSAGAAGYYQVVVFNPQGYSVTSAPPALITLAAPTASAAVTELWSVAPGSIPSISDFTGTSYDFRGLAYDTNTDIVLICDYRNIYLLSASNGSYLGELNMAGLATSYGTSSQVCQVGVADDGVLYSCNLTTTGPGFGILRWPTIAPGQSAGSYAYGGAGGADPGNGSGEEWGDTMTIRGGGTNTEMLIGSYGAGHTREGTNVVLFTTTDGASFTANIISVTNVPLGFSQLGVAFGAGDTFWATGVGNSSLVAFNRTNWTGGAVQSYTTLPHAFGGLAMDVSNNILGGVSYSVTPHALQLYLLSGNTNASFLFEQDFFPSSNPDIQDNSETVLKNGLGFALDNNNGVVALSYTVPAAPAVTFTSVTYAPGAVTLGWNTTFNNHNYQVWSAGSLSGPWSLLGSVTATNATASYVDTSAPGTSQFYEIISQ